MSEPKPSSASAVDTPVRGKRSRVRGMPKGSDKLEAVNKIMSDMKTDGTMSKIYEKWMGTPPAAGIC